MIRSPFEPVILSIARDLMSENDGENGEYDRAIVELTCGLLGLSTDHRDEVLSALRSGVTHVTVES